MENADQLFDIETIPLNDDYEGKNIAVLLKAKANVGNRKSVLYIPGFVDYFFHPHISEQFQQHGYDFYALELRKYGRALLKNQHAYFAKSLDEYFDEISFALKQIHEISKQPVLVFGHSTGGLTASVYANRGSEKNLISGLILNAPFLDMNVSNFELNGIKFMTEKLNKILPTYAVAQKYFPAAYVDSIHKNFKGEWDFNLEWKPLKGFPTYFAWLKTVIENQNFLKQNSNLTIPVLLLHSDKSVPPSTKGDAVNSADMVLNVEHMKQIGPKLSKDVTLVEVKNGLHDIFLSRKESRDFAFDKMFNWMESKFGK